jgi:hypothetical protein
VQPTGRPRWDHEACTGNGKKFAIKLTNVVVDYKTKALIYVGGPALRTTGRSSLDALLEETQKEKYMNDAFDGLK